MIKEGDRIPTHEFKIRQKFYENHEELFKLTDVNQNMPPRDQWRTLHLDKLLENKRAIIIGVPGAFTPTCAKMHVPGFQIWYRHMKAMCIDEIYVHGVNDPWVMWAWQKQQGLLQTIMLPDGRGEFAEKLGTLVDMPYYNYGKRTWRYSMVVDNFIVEKMFVEPGFPDDYIDDPFGETSALNMLKYLQSTGKVREEGYNPDMEFEDDQNAHIMPIEALHLSQSELIYHDQIAKKEYEEFKKSLDVNELREELEEFEKTAKKFNSIE